jgi:hypothetical protein
MQLIITEQNDWKKKCSANMGRKAKNSHNISIWQMTKECISILLNANEEFTKSHE